MQCVRCQLYGHANSYCNRPYVCVKCGGRHNTDSCKKSQTTTATCAVCGGGHSASSKGCDYYQKQYQAKYGNNRPQVAQRYASNLTQKQPAPLRPQNKTYVQALSGNGPMHTIPNADEPLSLTKFLGECKIMFNQPIQQNNMVLNTLTVLISKLHNG